MKIMFAAMSLGALLGLSPLSALAQSTAAPEPMQVAQAGTAHAGGGGSHRSHVRHRRNAHRVQARAGAEHVRTMRHPHPVPKH